MAGKRKARYRQQNYRPMKWKRKRTAQFKLEWKPRAQGDGMSCLRHAARTRQLEGDGWAYSCAIAGGRAGVTLASRVVWDGGQAPHTARSCPPPCVSAQRHLDKHPRWQMRPTSPAVHPRCGVSLAGPLLGSYADI
jgi:hypothetical protein